MARLGKILRIDNYGWDCREGAHEYFGPDNDNFLGCASPAFTDPIVEYRHDNVRCSITGGYRCRCNGYLLLRGVYLFADFCAGEIIGTIPRRDSAWESQRLLDAPFNITAFGEDSAGEIYVTERVITDSAVSKVHQLAVAEGVSETRRACDTLTVGPNLAEGTGGELVLQAGTSIVLSNDFRAE